MPQRGWFLLLALLLRCSAAIAAAPCTCNNTKLPHTVERVRFDGRPTECFKSHSQYHEEEKLTAQFGWKEVFDGTYVEIGAQDADGYSNTLSLASCNKWRGVLIEGSRSNFEKLKVNVPAQGRPGVTAFWGAVCAPPTLKVLFSQECGRGMSVGGEVAQMAPAYKRVFSHKHCPPQPVPCKPFSWYLGKSLGRPTAVVDEAEEAPAGPPKPPLVNFMSVDVEGAELVVLETLNLTAVTVDVLMVEMTTHDPPKNWKITQVLDNAGYRKCTQVTVRASGVFVRRASPLISRC